MPWKGVTVSEQRQQFIEDYQLTIAPSQSYPKDSVFPRYMHVFSHLR